MLGKKVVFKTNNLSYLLISFFVVCASLVLVFFVEKNIARAAQTNDPNITISTSAWPSSIPVNQGASFGYIYDNNAINSAWGQAFEVGLFVRPSGGSWPGTPNVTSPHTVPQFGPNGDIGSISWTPTTCGTYFVRVKADWNSQVIEQNETDNYAPNTTGKTITVVCPNLYIQEDGANPWSTEVKFYEDVNFNYNIYNTGALSGAFDAEFFIKKEFSIWESQGIHSFSSLDAGDSVADVFTWSEPAPHSQGTYFAKVVIDKNNSVDESNETDNEYPDSSGSQFTIPYECQSVAGLYVSNTTFSSVTFSWTGGFNCPNTHIIANKMPSGSGTYLTDTTENTYTASISDSCRGGNERYLAGVDTCNDPHYSTMCPSDPNPNIIGCDPMCWPPETTVCVQMHKANWSMPSWSYIIEFGNGLWLIDGKISPETNQVCGTTPPSLGPQSPTNVSPSDGSFVSTLTPTLSSSGFDYSTCPLLQFSKSQWQVCSNSNCSSIVWDSGTDNPHTSKTVGVSLSKNTTYYWRVRYRDEYSVWSNYSNTTSFAIDIDPPIIDSFTVNSKTYLTDPARTQTANVTIDWTAHDDGIAGLNRTEVWRAQYNSSNCSDTNKSGCSWSSIYTDSSSPQNGIYVDAPGENQWWYGLHVVDNLGNCVTETGEDCSGSPVPGRSTLGPIWAIIDGTAPLISFSPLSQAWTNVAFSVTPTVSDNVSGVDANTLDYCWAESPSSCVPSTGFTSASPIGIGSNEGQNRIYATATDNNGNVTTPNQGYYEYDITDPTIDALSINNYVTATTIVNGTGQPNVTWTVSDQANLSGLGSVVVRRGAGTCAVAALAGVSGSIAQTGTSSSGSWTDTTVPNDGDFCYGLEVFDAADANGPGNSAVETALQKVDVQVDTEPPNVNFSSASPLSTWQKNSVSVTISADDANTVNNGVDFTRHCWQDSTGGDTDCDPLTTPVQSTFSNGSSVSESTTGNWYVCARTRDGAENWNPVPTVANSLCYGPYYIDNDAPTGASVAGDGAAQCEKVTWTVSGATDAHSGLHSTDRYSFDNGISWQFANSKIVTVTGGGTDTRTIMVQDAVGNIWSSGSVTSGVTEDCDPNPPNITFSIPSRNWSSSDANVTITADDISDVSYGRYCFTEEASGVTCDPGTTATNTSPFACTGTTTQCVANVNRTTNGSWYLCARARDNSTSQRWNKAPTSVNGLCAGPYQVDKTAPTATLSADVSTCDQVTWQTASATDAHSGLHDTSPYSFDSGTAVWQIASTKTETVVGGGNVSKTLRVRDNAGNELSQVVNATVTDCNQAPNDPASMSQSPGSEGSLTTNNTPSFDFTISDPNGGDTIGYRIQIASNSSFSGPTIDYTWPGLAINNNPVRYDVPGSCPGGPDYATCTAPLPDGVYYWRVLAKDQTGATSGWVQFGISGTADFTVDTSAPNQPTCTPPGGTYTSTQNVTLVSIGSDSIRYNLDAAAPTNCSSGSVYSSPITIAASATINAVGCDTAGNKSTPESCIYDIGNYPNTTISSGPTDPINSDSATFNFSGTNSPTSYECKLDVSANQNTTWSACSSPKTYTGLNQGTRIFSVRAINTYGTDSSPANYSWHIDLTHPDIDDNGSYLGFEVDGLHLSDSPITTANTSIDIGWNVTDSGGSGLWKAEIWRYGADCATASTNSWSGASVQTEVIDAPPYPGPVTDSRLVMQALAEGTYCYGIHVLDHAGSCLTDEGNDCSSGSAVIGRPTVGPIEITIDTNVAPNLPINLSQSPGAEGALTNDNTPNFSFEISDSNGGDTVGYQIQIDDVSSFASPAIDYTWGGSTTNPYNVTYQVPDTCPGSGYTTCTAPLADGTYYWRVRAKDQDNTYSSWGTDAGNTATDFGFDAAGADFTIDTNPPNKPTCTPGSQSFTTTITVSCSGDAGSTLYYTLDGGATNQYTGDLVFSDSTTLEVWAQDQASNVSAVPNNSYSYTKGNLPNTLIDNPKPIDPTSSDSATLNFSGTNSPSSFQCELDPDATGYISCTSPKNYTSLTEGLKTFSVYAVNSYGDDSSTPATYSWLVDLTYPNIDTTGAYQGFEIDGNTVSASPFTTSNTNLSIGVNTDDSGGSGLQTVELWRYADICTNADAAGWATGPSLDVSTRLASTPPYPGPGLYNELFAQTVSEGTYCYGLHITDFVGHCLTEKGQDCTTSSAIGGRASVGPIEIIVSLGAAPYFTVTAQTPTSQTVAPGASANYTIKVNGFNGYAGTTSFSASGLPAGTVAVFSPTSCSPTNECSTIMTLTTSGSTPNGSSTVTVTGDDGSTIDTDTVTLTVSSTNVAPNVPKLCGPNELGTCDSY